MRLKGALRRNEINEFITRLYDGDLHAKRVLSLANGTLGVLSSASLAVHAVGQVPVAHHRLAPVGQLLVTERRQVLLELRRHRSLDQPSRARPKKLREGGGNRC